MALSNEIVLRPRFNLELDKNLSSILGAFENPKSNLYKVKRVDEHIFIKIPKEKQHFWSPQLHIEIGEVDEKKSRLHGFFGPNPSVWTLFMFLHYVVATIFIIFGIWAYSNWSLKIPYELQLGVVISMFFCWFALYFAGRMGKIKGKEQMRELYNFMEDILIKG